MVRSVFPLVGLLTWAALAHAQVFIDRDTTFDSIVDVQIRVIDGPNGPTTVEVLDGADIPAINVYGNSVLNVRGGRIQDDLAALDNARVNIFGGTVGAFEEDVWAVDSSVINIYGGVFGDDIIAGDSGAVNLYGGRFLKAGDGATLVAEQDGKIDVYLQHFEVLPYPPPPSKPNECCSILLGTLADGTSVNLDLFVPTSNRGSAQISLHIVPEPSSISLLGGVVLALLLRVLARDKWQRCLGAVSALRITGGKERCSRN